MGFDTIILKLKHFVVLLKNDYLYSSLVSLILIT